MAGLIHNAKISTCLWKHGKSAVIGLWKHCIMLESVWDCFNDW
jgi:hypothetical protein